MLVYSLNISELDMLELIVLGQIPGTNYRVTFSDVLSIALVLSLMQLVVVTKFNKITNPSRKPEEISI